MDDWTDFSAEPAVRVLQPLLTHLQRFHAHRVEGLERFPATGPVILAVNHSFATYDVFLLGLEVYRQTGRFVRALGDRLIFKTPGLRTLARLGGGLEGRPETAQSLLQAGEVVMVAPGGMLEALRPRQEKYQLKWQRRRGFARMALLTGAPVVLAACPRADDLYTLYDNPITKKVYERFRVPLPLLRGAGLSLLPRRVPLLHRVCEPLYPPACDPSEIEDALPDFHAQLVSRMNRLMGEALAAANSR